MKKAFKIIRNWIFFLAVVAGIWYLLRWINLIAVWRSLPSMTGLQVLSFALSLAFTWVEIFKWGSVKPFNCIKCLTGWFSLIMALLFHVEFAGFYLFAGLFAGAMFEGIKMRWL